MALQSDILDELLQRKPGLVFAVIDACRDNPFDLGTKSVTKGLVVQQTVPGTLVVYAAGARQQALDRLGGAEGLAGEGWREGARTIGVQWLRGEGRRS